jgi:hypothetical protein
LWGSWYCAESSLCSYSSLSGSEIVSSTCFGILLGLEDHAQRS